MPVTISGDGTFAGLTSVETVNVLHPDAVTNNIVLADDGSVALDSIPASIQSAIDNIPVLAGIGSNVVSVTKVDAFSTSSTSFVDVTDMTVTITPTSATSKVLVVAMLHASHSAGDRVSFRLLRGATPIVVGAQGYTTSASVRSEFGLDFPHVLTVDSPDTTSATTYEIEMQVASGTGYVNRRGFSGDILGVSSLTAIEVAA